MTALTPLTPLSAPRITKGWTQLATATLLITLISGFRAYENLYPMKPKIEWMVQAALLVAVVMLADAQRVRRVILPVPATLFVLWWMFSYLWSSDRPGFVNTTPKDLVALIGVVIIGQLLTFPQTIKLVMRVGVAALVLMIITLVLHPESAYVRNAEVPGLRGSFIHKNFMAPVFILVAMTAMCFEPRRWVRQVAVAGAFVLCFLGQTTTGLLTMAMIVALNAVLRRWTSLARTFGRAFGIALVGGLAVVTLVANSVIGYVLALNGKDFTFSSRTLIWRGVVHAIGQRPVGGWGWGVWANLYQDPAASINRPLGFQVAISHSAPLELLLRVGVVGFGLFLWQFVATMRRGRALLAAGDPLGRLIMMFGLMLVIFGFSEAHVAIGAWFGVLCLLAVVRIPDAEPPVAPTLSAITRRSVTRPGR